MTEEITQSDSIGKSHIEIAIELYGFLRDQEEVTIDDAFHFSPEEYEIVVKAMREYVKKEFDHEASH